MLIKNAKIFVGKSFLEGDIRFGRTIEAVGHLEGDADWDAQGCYVVPGLVDVHTHGAVGEDFSDGRAEGMQPLADYYAAHGATSYLATTMTLKEETLTPAMHMAQSAPGSIWRGPSCAMTSGAPRRRKTSTSRTWPCSTGSTRPAAAR